MNKKLEYPIHYDIEVANKVNNGCGPAGWKGYLIPDTIWGVSIKEACKIHDYDFHVGGTMFNFMIANSRFGNNMNTLIKSSKLAKCTPFLNWARRRRAKLYYDAVREFGEKHFNFIEE